MLRRFKHRVLFGISPIILLTSIAVVCPPAQAGFIATATLSGVNEQPSPNNSAATGFATMKFDSVTDTLMYDVLYSGLAGVATVAHIHVGPITIAGPVVLPLIPSPSGTFGELTGLLTNANIINQGVTGLSDISQIAAQIQAGNVYVNLHSTLFPAGEIRGQLAAVPEPASLFLVCASLIALAVKQGRETARRSSSRESIALNP